MDKEAQDPQQEHQQDPRKQFEQNLLKQAQGFWNMLQGKGSELLLSTLALRYSATRNVLLSIFSLDELSSRT